MGQLTGAGGDKPALVQSLLAEALAFHQKGLLTDARHQYEQILSLQPDHFDALLLIGLLAIQSGECQRAADFLVQAIEIQPGHAGAHFNLGNALKELHQYQAAVLCYDHAILCGHVGSDYNRGIALNALELYAEAIVSFDKSLTCKSDYPDAWYHRGNAQNEIGQYEMALISFDKAIALRTDFARAYCNRGIALQNLNRQQCVFHANWTPIPRQTGQSERSDAGVLVLL